MSPGFGGRLLFDFQFDSGAAVEGAAFRSAVVSDGVVLAMALANDVFGGSAKLDQVGFQNLSASHAKFHIVLRRANIIGMTVDGDSNISVHLEGFTYSVESIVGLAVEHSVGLVSLEVALITWLSCTDHVTAHALMTWLFGH